MIVPAGLAHAAPMAAIHAASLPVAEAWSVDVFADLMNSVGVSGLISAEGGFLLLRKAADEADVLTITVLPGVRRAGLGRKLLAAGLAQMASEGIARVFLEVSEANSAAIGLYHTEGFATVGRRRGYYKDGSTALLMRQDAPF